MGKVFKTILYIEDEQELAEEIIELLESANIKAVHSPDYGDAVSKAMNQKFDLIIADIHLKKGTADRIIQGIKSNPRHVNYRTPILVASSQVTRELLTDIQRYIDYAIVKPFKLQDLLAQAVKLMAS